MPLLASTLAGGSSNSKWANARCAAIASMPVQRCKDAWRAADRKQAGTSRALEPPPPFQIASPLPHPPRRACTGELPPVPGMYPAFFGWPQRMASDAVSAGSRLTIARYRRDQGGVYAGLRPLPKQRGRSDVHVPEQDVRGHTCASLAEHAGCCRFERRTPRAQNSGRGAGRTVIAQWVQGAAAPASAWRHGEAGVQARWGAS